MEITDELVATVRKGIVETLQLLARPEEQNAYPLPVEWFCFWFDDLYHPNSPAHHRAFSKTESEVLANFNDFFEAVSEQIGEPPATPDELRSISAWQELMAKAKETLLKLEDA